MPEPEPDPGGDGRAAQPRGEVVLARDRAGVDASRPPPSTAHQRSPNRCVRRPRRSPRGGRDGLDRRRPRRRSTGTARSGRPSVSRRTCRVATPVPGGATLDDDAAVGGEQLAQRARAGRPGRRRCRCCRRRAGRSPSGPRPGSGSKTSRSSAGTPRSRVCRTASGTTSMPSTDVPGVGQGLGHPARAAADVEGRSVAEREQRAVDRVGVAQPGVRPAAAPDAVGVQHAQGRPRSAVAKTCATETASSTTVIATPPARRGGSGRRRAHRPRASASATVSTSRSVGSRPDRRARRATQRVAGVGAGVGARHRHAGQAGRRGRVAAGPAPTSRRRRPGPARRPCSPRPRRPRGGRPAVTCGVSMPIWTVGPGPAASAWAWARRSPKPSPRCGCTAQPASCVAELVAADGVARGRRRGRGGTRRTPRRQAASVSSSAAAASPAAASMPITAPSRVFTRPGDGRLGHDQRPHAGHAAPSQKSRAVRTVPRREPLTLERVPAARGR